MKADGQQVSLEVPREGQNVTDNILTGKALLESNHEDISDKPKKKTILLKKKGLASVKKMSDNTY